MGKRRITKVLVEDISVSGPEEDAHGNSPNADRAPASLVQTASKQILNDPTKTKPEHVGLSAHDSVAPEEIMFEVFQKKAGT